MVHPAGAIGGAILGQTLAELHRLLRARRPAEAMALLGALPPGERGRPAVRAAEAYAAALSGRLGAAIAAAKAALASGELDALSLDLAGNALVLANDPASAYPAFARAAALAPCDPDILFNLAAAARFLGREDEAEAAYDEVIRRAPATWRAYRNRSELRVQTATENHVEELERLLRDAAPPWQGEVQLRYALGKEYEDLERYDAAFQSFARGAAVRRAHMRYDAQDDIRTLQLIAAAFDTAYCAPGRARAEGPGPIFVLGLPRTGSTLLESLLGRRTDVQPLGELQQFGAALTAVARQAAAGPVTSKAQLIAAAARAAPTQIGRAYLEAVEPLRDGAAWFVDKLPLNYLYAGAIARALPNAAIIHMRRNPADLCLAMFKTLFDEAYPFSYDLAELGRYHNAYRALMAHWRKALGPRLIETSYEALVADPAAETRRLLAAAGLEPSGNGAEDARAALPVMTASASQVRRPIHRRSVDSATRYGQRLAPLLAVLERPGVPA